MDQIKPLERNAFVGALADVLARAKQKTGVAGDVLLGEIPQALDDWSYGQRMTTGSGWTTQMKPGTADLAMAAIPAATKLAPAVPKAMARGLQNLESTRRIPNSAQRGAIVWHGSPYKFDKFDSAKIGTGEGAQVYGRGLYFAESPKVAQQYKDLLGAGRGNTDADTVARVLEAVGGDGMKAAAELEKRAQYANIPGGKERLLSLAEQVRGGFDPRGALYKVDLPDPMINRMLDWDAPLSSSVKKNLARDAEARGVASRREALEALLDYDYTRHAFEAAVGPEQAQLAEALRRMGIPGVKYLDGNSRAVGEGTRNFVVFPGEENAVRILERNGRPLR